MASRQSIFASIQGHRRSVRLQRRIIRSDYQFIYKEYLIGVCILNGTVSRVAYTKENFTLENVRSLLAANAPSDVAWRGPVTSHGAATTDTRYEWHADGLTAIVTPYFNSVTIFTDKDSELLREVQKENVSDM
jgi:hypothetical protein